MSISINFTFTQKGQASVFNAQKTGTALNLTHIQLGSGNKAPAGTELALVAPQQVAAIAAGSSVSPTQIRMSAIFGGPSNFNIGEIGLWSGDPAVSTSILVAYWSQASGFLAVKSNGVDFVFSHDMVLNTAVPPGSITILADQAQSAMLAAINNHQAAADPHPQYTTDAEVLALIEARVGDYVVAGGTANAITAVLVPAITSYNANTSLTFKAAATNTAAVTLDAGGGAKPLVREDGTPMQAGDVLAGMVVTVVYDVATTSFRSTEMVQSQVAGQIAQAAQTQANTACATAGTAPAFTASPTPQLRALGANVRLRVKFHSEGTGADTLNVSNFGAKSLKQYDSTGAKVAAVFAANQLVDVEFDGTDFVLLDPLPQKTLVTLSGGIPLPTSNIGPIWHADYNSLMTWQTFNANGAAYTGYASVDVGGLYMDTQPTARVGYVKSGVSNLSRTAYAALRNWAIHNGVMVAAAAWAAGAFVFKDNADGTTFSVADVRGEFPRFWDNGRGLDAGRAMGSWQFDTFKSHNHNQITDPLSGQSLTTLYGHSAWNSLNNANLQTNNAGSIASYVHRLLNSSLADVGGAETRPRNVALLASIKF